MAYSTRIAPPNSILLIMDYASGVIPKSMNGKMIVATESCIALGCRAEMDGETLIVLGKASEVDPGRAVAFDAKIATPSGRLVVRSALNQTILEMPVATKSTTVRVWVNDTMEPDEVVIGLA